MGMRITVFIFGLIVFGISVSNANAAEEEITVHGDSCYMYGDSETPKTAKKTALNLAKRAAVENYRVFIDSSSVVEMGALKEDIMASVSGGYLYNLKVVKQEERGREICVSVSAVIKPREVDAYIDKKLAQQKAAKNNSRVQVNNTGAVQTIGVKGGAAATGRRIPPQCRDELDTTVALHDYLQPGERTAQLRSRLLQQATHDAVRQTMGVKVRSNSAMDLFSSNEKQSQQFAQRMASQAKGLVRYEIEQENSGQDNIGQWFWVRIAAHVCVPKNPLALKEVVRIDHALTSRGEELDQFRDIMEDIFSNTSAFAMAGPDESFADVVISGKVNHVKVKPISNGRRNRIDVNLTLKALRTTDNETVTQNFRDFKVVKASTDTGTAADNFVIKLIAEAGAKLHDKLLSKRPDADRIPKAAEKSGSDEPDW